MKVSAKVDYALRAAAELARAYPEPLKCEHVAQVQGVPQKFLENILLELKHANLVQTQRGTEGGHRLARPPAEITLADLIRVLEGPLANVRGERPHNVNYQGAAASLREVWIAVRAGLRAVLESVTLADIARGELPESVHELTRDPAAWRSR